jgi:hypothetical protein
MLISHLFLMVIPELALLDFGARQLYRSLMTTV